MQNLNGLTREEVKQKVEEGKVNCKPDAEKTSIKDIIFRNVFTLFNFVNLILVIAIIIVGSYKNAVFFLVAIWNTVIGIINEVRAKKIIDKMTLISQKKQKVIREGQEVEVAGEEIVEGDLVCFGLGTQIIVDAEVVEGSAEVNESFITGESDNVQKKKGDKLLSGSFVVSGVCKAIATGVGEDNFINKVTKETAKIKSSRSKLFNIMNNIIKYISYALIPIGILLVCSKLFVANFSVDETVISTVASLSSMIPQGLVLLISSVLALAAIKLSKKDVLVQDLYSVETLARVDAICLDKTGTITTGNMKVKEVIPYGNHTEDEVRNAVAKVTKILPADNSTSKALKEAFGDIDVSTEDVVEPIPFSSDKKYSGVELKDGKILMGATEFMTNNSQYLSKAEELTGDNRLICVMASGDDLLGFVAIEDEIRTNAKEILDFFAENDVKTFIISGDGINTVTRIAQKVGIEDAKAVDMSTFDEPDYDQLVQDYTIFTRVKPNQKKCIVLALKKAGYTVAMTGDGVNDVLAMKEADCSISIGDGADAARRVSKLVLLNSDFTAIPSIIGEGRQTINNLERSASLFLSKTTFSALLAVIFVFMASFVYPYIPIGLTFIDFVIIGFPGFALALQPNKARIKNQFVKNIVKFSVPTGIAVTIAIVCISVCNKMLDLSMVETLSIAAVTTIIISLYLVIRIALPLDKFRTAVVLFCIFSAIVVFAIPFARSIFVLEIPSATGWIIILALSAILIPITVLLGKLTMKIYDKKFQD